LGGLHALATGRSEQPFLHRISTTPRVLRDVDEGTTTYTFEAEPAEMHEMFKDMEFSYFHGHHSQVPHRLLVLSSPHGAGKQAERGLSDVHLAY
jgi:hypothetical protein